MRQILELPVCILVQVSWVIVCSVFIQALQLPSLDVMCAGLVGLSLLWDSYERIYRHMFRYT